MSHSQLLEDLQKLSPAEKFKIIQFLVIALVKEEGLSLGNEDEAIINEVHISKLMQFFAKEKEYSQNIEKNDKLSLKDAAKMMRHYYAESSSFTEFVDDCPEEFYEYQDYA